MTKNLNSFHYLLFTFLMINISCEKEDSFKKEGQLSSQIKGIKVYRQEFTFDILDSEKKLMNSWVYNIHGDVITWEKRQVLGLTDYGLFSYRYEYKYNTKYKITEKKEYEFGDLNDRVGFIYDNSDTLILKMFEYGFLGVDTILYEYDSLKRLTKETKVYSDGDIGWIYDYSYNDLNQVDYKLFLTTDFYNNSITNKYEYKYDPYGNILEERHISPNLSIYTNYFEYKYDQKERIIEYVERYDGKSLKYKEQIDYNENNTIKSKTIYSPFNVKEFYDSYEYEYFYNDELE